MAGRLFIYPKDLQIITGKHIKTCRIMYNHLLDALEKTRLQGITIKEYCEYAMIDVNDVLRAIKA